MTKVADMLTTTRMADMYARQSTMTSLEPSIIDNMSMKGKSGPQYRDRIYLQNAKAGLLQSCINILRCPITYLRPLEYLHVYARKQQDGVWKTAEELDEK
jgi:hypothetical protein